MQPAKAVQRLQAVSSLSRQLPCTASLAARGKVRARKLCRLWVCKGTPGFRCRNTPPLALSGFLFPPGPDTAAFQVAPISFRLVALSNHFISLSLSLCLCPSLSTRTWQTVELHVISQPRGKKKTTTTTLAIKPTERTGCKTSLAPSPPPSHHLRGLWSLGHAPPPLPHSILYELGCVHLHDYSPQNAGEL